MENRRRRAKHYYSLFIINILDHFDFGRAGIYMFGHSPKSVPMQPLKFNAARKASYKFGGDVYELYYLSVFTRSKPLEK